MQKVHGLDESSQNWKSSYVRDKSLLEKWKEKQNEKINKKCQKLAKISYNILEA